MPKKLSAGILLCRLSGGRVEVFLIHPGVLDRSPMSCGALSPGPCIDTLYVAMLK